MLRSFKESKNSNQNYRIWKNRLDQLISGDFDVKDDGHLYEWFDKKEWEKIFGELEKMPNGARSLKRAILSIDPDYTDYCSSKTDE